MFANLTDPFSKVIHSRVNSLVRYIRSRVMVDESSDVEEYPEFNPTDPLNLSVDVDHYLDGDGLNDEGNEDDLNLVNSDEDVHQLLLRNDSLTYMPNLQVRSGNTLAEMEVSWADKKITLAEVVQYLSSTRRLGNFSRGINESEQSAGAILYSVIAYLFIGGQLFNRTGDVLGLGDLLSTLSSEGLHGLVLPRTGLPLLIFAVVVATDLLSLANIGAGIFRKKAPNSTNLNQTAVSNLSELVWVIIIASLIQSIGGVVGDLVGLLSESIGGLIGSTTQGLSLLIMLLGIVPSLLSAIAARFDPQVASSSGEMTSYILGRREVNKPSDDSVLVGLRRGSRIHQSRVSYTTSALFAFLAALFFIPGLIPGVTLVGAISWTVLVSILTVLNDLSFTDARLGFHREARSLDGTTLYNLRLGLAMLDAGQRAASFAVFRMIIRIVSVVYLATGKSTYDFLESPVGIALYAAIALWSLLVGGNSAYQAHGEFNTAYSNTVSHAMVKYKPMGEISDESAAEKFKDTVYDDIDQKDLGCFVLLLSFFGRLWDGWGASLGTPGPQLKHS